MKPIGIKNIYNFDQLEETAKEKAREWFREGHDDPMMQSHMINLLKEELDERGIKYNEDSIDVRYSLSYSQGDGFMFIGELEWNKYTIYIKHGGGRYYHSNSAQIEMQETENLGFHVDDDHEDFKKFDAIYQEICKVMESKGYSEIEYQNSAEYIDESIEANEYTFTKEGERLDADEEISKQSKEDREKDAFNNGMQ